MSPTLKMPDPQLDMPKPEKRPAPEGLPPLPEKVLARMRVHEARRSLSDDTPGKKSSREAIMPSSHQQPTDARVSSKKAVPSELPDVPAMPKQIHWKSDKAA
jgi:hypothetical protein